jgi:DNA-binding CsgD family transcriptional regulator
MDHWEKFVTMPVRRDPPPTPVVRLPPRAVLAAPEAPQKARRPKDQRRRARPVRNAQQEERWDRVVELYQTRPDLSLPDIARIVGYRNHTSLLYILARKGAHDPAARQKAKHEKHLAFLDAERARIEARKQARLRRIEEKENRAARKLALRVEALAQRRALAAARLATGAARSASLGRIERAVRVKELIQRGLSNAEIAQRFGLSRGHVQNIRRGWRWAGLP